MPVPIKVVKDQGLSLNPVKISGLCGCLMCCLKCKSGEYEAAKKELPDYGKEVITPNDKGKVVRSNLLGRIVKVRLHGREVTVDYNYEEIKETITKVVAEKGDQNG